MWGITPSDIRIKGLESMGKYYSDYPGIVYDRKDPDKQGRIKIKIPQVFGNQIYDYWAKPKGMFIGDSVGMFTIPEVDDLVWVSFEAGDVRFPLWEPGYKKQNSSIEDLYDEDGEPSKVMLRTVSGHIMFFDDKNKNIRIADANGNQIELDDKGISLIPKGNNKISLGKLDGSKYKAVLGDKNKDVLDKLHKGIQDLAQALTTDATAGAAGAGFILAGQTLTTAPQVLANMIALIPDIPQTNSEKVTLE